MTGCGKFARQLPQPSVTLTTITLRRRRRARFARVPSLPVGRPAQHTPVGVMYRAAGGRSSSVEIAHGQVDVGVLAARGFRRPNCGDEQHAAGRCGNQRSVGHRPQASIARPPRVFLSGSHVRQPRPPLSTRNVGSGARTLWRRRNQTIGSPATRADEHEDKLLYGRFNISSLTCVAPHVLQLNGPSFSPSLKHTESTNYCTSTTDRIITLGWFVCLSPL